MEGPINYPPDEISQPIFGKPNFELIILWMLNNNDCCTWADFKEIIKPSTLSLYLKDLKEQVYVDHSEYNEYRITSKGKDRYYELSQSKGKERQVNYPPIQMLRSGRNYEDWILWMAYNNNYLQWSDFLQNPVSINQSSLSKTLNHLMDEENEFIRKDEKKHYHITQYGKSEYSRILRKYQLDRQSILDSESERIKDITKKTIEFFERYEINDNELKFRFINHALKLPYPKVKNLLPNEADFHKILLYLSINHPSQFPNFLSKEEFVKKYNIEQPTLEFFFLQILEKELYPIKFFTLESEDGSLYIFQEGEKIEKILKATVEEHITKFTYLNRLYENEEQQFISNLDLIINSILEDILGRIFDYGLRSSLENFLPSYIQHLAFKFKSKKRYRGSIDKLKGLIWRDLKEFEISKPEVVRTVTFEEQIEVIEDQMKSQPDNIELYQSMESVLLYHNKIQDLKVLYDEMMRKFPKNKKKVLIKKAYIFKEDRKIEEGFEIIDNLLKNSPDDLELRRYKAYWLSYLDRKAEALNLIRILIKEAPDNPSLHDTYGELLMTFGEYAKAINAFEKVFEFGKNEWYIFQTYIKYGICHRNLGNNSIAFEALIRGKEAANESKALIEEKQKWLSLAEPFIQELKEIQT